MAPATTQLRFLITPPKPNSAEAFIQATEYFKRPELLSSLKRKSSLELQQTDLKHLKLDPAPLHDESTGKYCERMRNLLPADRTKMVVSAPLQAITRIVDQLQSDHDGTKVDLAGTKAELAGTQVDLAGTKAELAGTKVDLVGTKAELARANVELAETKSLVLRLYDDRYILLRANFALDFLKKLNEEAAKNTKAKFFQEKASKKKGPNPLAKRKSPSAPATQDTTTQTPKNADGSKQHSSMGTVRQARRIDPSCFPKAFNIETKAYRIVQKAEDWINLRNAVAHETKAAFAEILLMPRYQQGRELFEPVFKFVYGRTMLEIAETVEHQALEQA